ncbi:MAG: Asp23/Gls24 family envelope stress response protein [Atopobiaceae bacterium]|nr:Asp23/Gls24 family envelope stress response protein [Atopobiaceae bacterium]
MAEDNEREVSEIVEVGGAAEVPTTIETGPEDVPAAPEEGDIARTELAKPEEPGEPEEPASDDSLTFSNGVIEKIVAISMREVPGVLGMKGSWFNRFQSTFGVDDATKGVTVEVTPENSVKVNISVLIEYGAYAPQVFEDTKRVVVERILSMTGLSVAGVNLRIEDVLTAEEYERYRARREAEARARRGADERQKEMAQKGEE